MALSRSAADVAGIVLAAGASSRLGQPKPLIRCGGSTLLGATVAAYLEAGLGRVVVVLGHDAARIAAEAALPGDERLAVVEHAGWRDGMASSLQRGLAACQGLGAALVGLADQPGVTAERVGSILERWLAAQPAPALVVPVAPDGRASHPVLFASSLWPELLALRGDVGAREVVARHWEAAVKVAAERLHDLDTPEDLQRWRAGQPPPPGGFTPR